MRNFEILCVTMHQHDFSKIKEMNIHSDVVFANQCDRTAYEEFEFDGYLAKMISTNTRGVGINRNLSLMYASAEICLLADDDVTYNDNYQQVILREFEEHPDADIFIFHFETDSERKQIKYQKTKKVKKFARMPWGGIRIAFRLTSIKKANINFTTLFGGGCIFPSGEDSIFLIDAKRKGLKMYVSKETIGSVFFKDSSWYTGIDEKFFFGKGAFYAAVHPHTKYLWMIYFALRTKGELSMIKKFDCMFRGNKKFKKLR